jgi:hypothetical protein
VVGPDGGWVAGGFEPGALGGVVPPEPVVPRRIVVVGARPCPVVSVGAAAAGGAVVSATAAAVVAGASPAGAAVVDDGTRTTRAAAGDCGASDRISVATARVDALIPTSIPANTSPLSAPMMRRWDRAGCNVGRVSRSMTNEGSRNQLTLGTSTGQPIELSLMARGRGPIS